VAQTHDKTILVVDDEADVRRYLSMALEDAGFRVLTASDGDEGLKIMAEATGRGQRSRCWWSPAMPAMIWVRQTCGS